MRPRDGQVREGLRWVEVEHKEQRTSLKGDPLIAHVTGNWVHIMTKGITGFLE